MQRLLPATAVTLVTLIVAPAAAAEQGKPRSGSSVSQYVETVPTGEGSTAVGGGASSPPSAVSQYVEAIPTGEGSAAVGASGSGPGAGSGDLDRIANSPAWGAPTAPTPSGVGPGAEADITSTPGASQVIGTALETLGEGSRTRLVALALVLLAVTAAFVATTTSRRTR